MLNLFGNMIAQVEIAAENPRLQFPLVFSTREVQDFCVATCFFGPQPQQHFFKATHDKPPPPPEDDEVIHAFFTEFSGDLRLFKGKAELTNSTTLRHGTSKLSHFHHAEPDVQDYFRLLLLKTIAAARGSMSLTYEGVGTENEKGNVSNSLCGWARTAATAYVQHLHSLKELPGDDKETIVNNIVFECVANNNKNNSQIDIDTVAAFMSRCMIRWRGDEATQRANQRIQQQIDAAKNTPITQKATKVPTSTSTSSPKSATKKNKNVDGQDNDDDEETMIISSDTSSDTGRKLSAVRRQRENPTVSEQLQFFQSMTREQREQFISCINSNSMPDPQQSKKTSKRKSKKHKQQRENQNQNQNQNENDNNSESEEEDSDDE